MVIKRLNRFKYLIAECNELMRANRQLVLGKSDAKRLERQALVFFVTEMRVDLRRLDLTVLHDHIIGDNGHHESNGDHEPDQEEQVDENGEEADGDATAETRSKPGEYLSPSGTCRQTSDHKKHDGQ